MRTIRHALVATWLTVLPLACSSPDAARAPHMEAAIGDARSPQTAGAAVDWRKQVLYLVMPDRFRNGDRSNDDAGSPACLATGDPQRFHGGDLEGLRQELGYVRELGATTVWVTPLYRQIGRLVDGHCGYHGYWGDFVQPYDDALEPKLGTPADLTRLVGDMHASGMRFVLDMVVNHTGDTAPLPHTQPSWFHDPHTCASLGDPTVFCPLDGHPDFAQEIPAVAAYLSDVAARWTRTYGIDGIRMDTAKHVPPSYFKSSFMPAVHGARAGLVTIAEIFDEGSTAPIEAYLDAGFDSAFHFPLRRALVDGIAHGGSIDLVASAVADGISRLGADRALDLVLMVDNHDVPRFANEPGVGVDEDDIRRRMLLSLDLVFTLPGVPQLYYGDEIGMYGGADPDNRRDFPDWATDPVARNAPHPGVAVRGAGDVFARVSRLSMLRKSTAALADGTYQELWRQNGPQNPNVFAFARGSGTGARLVVVNNGARSSGPLHIPVPAGVWTDGSTLVDDLGDGAPTSTVLHDAQLSIDLGPRSAAIYRLQ